MSVCGPAKPEREEVKPPTAHRRVFVFLLTPNNGQQISISQTLMATIKCRPVLMGVNSAANNNTPVLARFLLFFSTILRALYNSLIARTMSSRPPPFPRSNPIDAHWSQSHLNRGELHWVMA